jgi:DNA modification methylase
MLKSQGLKNKDLIGIPWMVAFALRADGWYLRQDIIWHKPNPMPESVTDRCTKAHEYVFLMSKSQRYYYDAEAIKQPIADASVLRLSQQLENQKGSDRVPGKTNGNMKAVGPGRNPRKGVDIRGGNQGSDNGIPAMAINGNGVTGHSGYFDTDGNLIGDGMANKKSVWTVTTQPFSEAHFATFPQKLIVDMIKAGCPEGGLVLDPFMGAGTAAVVSRKLNRNYIGFELNPEYIKIADKRLYNELGMFL